MNSIELEQRMKRLLFSLLGKDPEAVIVSFLTGDEARAEAMAAEIRRLEPGRRHFTVTLEEMEETDSAWLLWVQLRRRFRGFRIGLAPALFTDDTRYRALRWAAWMLAPTRLLAYNARGERHHPRLWSPVASLLFLRGVPLDRIFLRPGWLWPWKKDRTVVPAGRTVLDGRPLARSRPRIGVLTPYLPWPLAHGGAVRIYNLLREAAREFDVILFAFAEEDDPPDCGPLLEICAKIVLVGKPRYREPRWSTLAPPEVGEYRSEAMQSALEELRREFGFRLLQVEYTQLAEYSGDVLVEHDVTFDLYNQIHERERTLASWWNWWRWRRFEGCALERFQRVVLMSNKDVDLVARALLPAESRLVSTLVSDSRKRLFHRVVIANGVDLRHFQPAPEPNTQNLLFIGSFRHFPNVVAYRFFVEQVWPLLDKQFPQANLTAVAGPDPMLHWREFTITQSPPTHPRINLLSFVADVRPLYQAANLVIVPTLVSAGTNVKVLEAMAMERAVVATSSGCAGLGLEHGASVWVADTPEDFAAGVARLLTDAPLRARLARNARRHAERHFDWRRLGERQRELFHVLLGDTELLGDTVAVRGARPSDLDAITAIQAASPEAAAWEPATCLDYDCRVGVQAGRVAGFLCLRHVAGDEHEILNLAVAPSARRRGVAETLLRNAVDTLDGAIFLEVRESNHPARQLYSKIGFETSRRREYYYSQPTEAAIEMRFQSC